MNLFAVWNTKPPKPIEKACFSSCPRFPSPNLRTYSMTGIHGKKLFSPLELNHGAPRCEVAKCEVAKSKPEGLRRRTRLRWAFARSDQFFWETLAIHQEMNAASSASMLVGCVDGLQRAHAI